MAVGGGKIGIGTWKGKEPRQTVAKRFGKAIVRAWGADKVKTQCIEKCSVTGVC